MSVSEPPSVHSALTLPTPGITRSCRRRKGDILYSFAVDIYRKLLRAEHAYAVHLGQHAARSGAVGQIERKCGKYIPFRKNTSRRLQRTQTFVPRRGMCGNLLRGMVSVIVFRNYHFLSALRRGALQVHFDPAQALRVKMSDVGDLVPVSVNVDYADAVSAVWPFGVLIMLRKVSRSVKSFSPNSHSVFQYEKP